MSMTLAVPVTVSIARRVDPGRASEMVAWMRAGTALAEAFPGFLGAGWVQSGPGSPEWHMLYRFADAESLAAWEASPQRAWWLEAAAGDVEESRRERRTGIEGWFDEPASVESLSAAPTAPPRWKQMVVIFMGFFPLSLAVNVAVAHTALADWPLVLRVFATILVMTPLMNYVVLPLLTRRMSWWLHR